MREIHDFHPLKIGVIRERGLIEDLSRDEIFRFQGTKCVVKRAK